MGPDYLSCNEFRTSCTRTGADPFNGCLTCEYTIQRKQFLEDTEKKLENLPRGTWKGQTNWPLDYLLKQVIETSAVSSSRKGTDPNWTVVVANLVSIYRSEDAKIKAASTYRPEDNSPRKGPAIKDTPSNRNPYRTTRSLAPSLHDPDDDGVYD